jgi:hypothetical protein
VYADLLLGPRVLGLQVPARVKLAAVRRKTAGIQAARVYLVRPDRAGTGNHAQVWCRKGEAAIGRAIMTELEVARFAGRWCPLPVRPLHDEGELRSLFVRP